MSDATPTLGGRRFEILEALGQGAFGTVYRARMVGDGGFVKEVALKLLRTDLERDRAENMARRTRDEARLLGLVRHRALLHVDGLARLGGRWAVVMELVDGCSLRDLMRLGPVPPSVAVAVLREVAGGLWAAWEATSPDGSPLRLVHRDIKPANLQLSVSGDVKVLDFGVARAQFEGRESETVGMMLGTLRYMAPERFDGIDGPEGDVYALGVVLAELLTCEAVAKTSGNLERHEAVVAEALGRLHARLPADPDPEPLIALIEAMVAYDPSDRPSAQSVEQRAWDLQRTWTEPRLPDFARATVPKVREATRSPTNDPLIGDVLSESSAAASRRWGWLVAALGLTTAGVLALVAASAGLLGGIALWASSPGEVAGVEPAPVVAPAPEALAPSPPPPPLPIEPLRAPVAAPVAAPPPSAPRPAAAAPTGTVRVEGEASITVTSGDGKAWPAGVVPTGAYDVAARFADGAEVKVGRIEVRAGQVVVVRCVPNFKLCKVAG